LCPVLPKNGYLRGVEIIVWRVVGQKEDKRFVPEF
jgi:hypothetical protein